MIFLECQKCLPLSLWLIHQHLLYTHRLSECPPAIDVLLHNKYNLIAPYISTHVLAMHTQAHNQKWRMHTHAQASTLKLCYKAFVLLHVYGASITSRSTAFNGPCSYLSSLRHKVIEYVAESLSLCILERKPNINTFTYTYHRCLISCLR